jgi:hypothetical protein
VVWYRGACIIVSQDTLAVHGGRASLNLNNQQAHLVGLVREVISAQGVPHMVRAVDELGEQSLCRVCQR